MATKIKKAVPLRDQVYEAILSQLRLGVYAPGDRVTEERVANDLDVSRTPVREAISQLHRNGVLAARKRGGYVVPSLTVVEVVEIFDVRKLVEPYALRLAAVEYGPDQISEIDRAIQEESRAVSTKDPGRFAVANARFRTAIFDAISNKTLTSVIHQFGNHLQFIRMITLKDVALRKEIVARQKLILEALAQKDGDTAQDLWIDYLEFGQFSLVNALKANH